MNRKHLVATATLLTLAGAASTADASEPWSRHPSQPDARRKPASVPSTYVFTHNGFFHPSCVTFLQPGEVVGRDLVIRGPDGAVHDRIEPCAYPRFDFSGRAVAGGLPHRVHGGGSSGGGDSTYDGWLLSYSDANSPTPGSDLSTKWIVPTPPTNVADQDIAFFNDIESNTAIVQPVLDFSELPGQWAIEAEALVGNNDVQSTLVAVNPGDLLLGTVTSSGCDASGVCQRWTITLKDTTTGQSTTQTTQAVTDAPNEVDAAVLETYGVGSCDKLPASGEVPFLDNALTAGGAAEGATFTFYSLSDNQANAEVPTDCGWNGMASGNDYTLIFGMDPTVPGDPDAGTDAGDPDAGTSSSGSGGGGSSGSGGSSSGGSSSGASSSSGSTSSGGSGSSGGTASGGGSGGGAPSSGGREPEAGAADEGFPVTGGGSGGCDVGAVGGDCPLAFALGIGILFAGRAHRRGGGRANPPRDAK